MKKKLIIHLGYPKTASTYLQSKIFPNLNGIVYLGKPFVNEDIIEFEKSIILSKNQVFLSKKNYLTQIIENITNNYDSSKFLLSHEGFLRSTRYNTEFSPIGNDIIETISRLHLTLSGIFDLSFIICIRKYDEILSSYLNQFINKFKFKYLEADFINDLNNISKVNILKNFYYGQLICKLNELNSNFKIFLYEDLKYDFRKFHLDLFKFLGVKEIYYDNIFINHNNTAFNTSKVVKLKYMIKSFLSSFLHKNDDDYLFLYNKSLISRNRILINNFFIMIL
jgi:hypothetical protein